MKKRALSLFVAVILLASLIVMPGVSAGSYAQAFDESEYLFNLDITYPSASQSTIASGRDFYVIGNITPNVEDTEIPDDTHFSVSLVNTDNEVVREVYADIKDYQEGLYADYDKLLTYSGDMSKSLMPDLVYDPSDESTFADAWRKCYYNNDNFTAAVCGGEYNLDINLIAEDGTALEPLDFGTYSIVVQAEYDG